MTIHRCILLAALCLPLASQAQPAAPAAVGTAGTLVIVPAYGEVRHANDEATVVFGAEEQDKDRAAATVRVNQKMKQGIELLRREDPQAVLKTTNYFTYPVYPEVVESPRPASMPPARRVPIGWRVGQTLEATTKNIDALPKTASAVQKALNLNGVDYHLSADTQRKLDEERIAATWKNLNERIGSIARAMGRNPSDAVVDTVDFEGSGNYAGNAEMAAARAPMMSMRMKTADAPPEVSFEPGETTLQMRLVGKVRFR